MQARKSAAKNCAEYLLRWKHDVVQLRQQKETLISFASTFYCINVIIHVKNKFAANKNTRLRRAGARARLCANDADAHLHTANKPDEFNTMEHGEGPYDASRTSKFPRVYEI